MKVAYCSDLHLEHDRAVVLRNEQSADVLVLAGDIIPFALLHNGKHKHRYVDFFKSTAQQFSNVVYVPGNHEYYGGDISTDVNKVREILCEITNLHILDNDVVNIEGVLFIGSTLWTDFQSGDPIKVYTAKQTMSDYRAITVSENPVTFRKPDRSFGHRPSKLTPEDTIEYHNHSRQFIINSASGDDTNVVVVSHHAPSFLSIHPRYVGDPLNGAFCSDCSDIMDQCSNIKLWIHGHTHTPFDYQVYDTHVVCNPRGYPEEYHNNPFSLQYIEV